MEGSDWMSRRRTADECQRRQDRVDGECDIGKLDDQDRRPERRQTQSFAGGAVHIDRGSPPNLQLFGLLRRRSARFVYQLGMAVLIELKLRVLGLVRLEEQVLDGNV